VGVDELLDVYALGGLTLKLSSLSLHIPYSKVMAMLVVAAKIYFKPLPPGKLVNLGTRHQLNPSFAGHGYQPGMRIFCTVTNIQSSEAVMHACDERQSCNCESTCGFAV
jgi:hypothetical protein